MTLTKMQIAAHKAWKTIRKNKKIFDGFKKPIDDFKFGIHLEPVPYCNGLCGEIKVFYYPSKEAMRNDIKKFRKDDQIAGITVFEVIGMKGNGIFEE